MIRTTLTGLSALAALALGAVQAQAHDYSNLPEPAYAYASSGGDENLYADEGEVCGRDQFTLIGAHAGGTLLGFNAGVGGHFGFGDGCHHHRHHARVVYAPREQAPPAPQAYAPPPPPPSYGAPRYYGQPQPGYYGAPMYGDRCGCMSPRGW